MGGDPWGPERKSRCWEDQILADSELQHWVRAIISLIDLRAMSRFLARRCDKDRATPLAQPCGRRRLARPNRAGLAKKILANASVERLVAKKLRQK